MSAFVKVTCHGVFHSPKWLNARPGMVRVMRWEDFEQLRSEAPKLFTFEQVYDELIEPVIRVDGRKRRYERKGT